MKECKAYIGDEKSAYDYGYDCGINGANKTNCNFSIFINPEKTKEWERGKKDAEKIVNNKNKQS